MSTLSISEKVICTLTNFLDMFENETKMNPWISVRNLWDICEIFVRYRSHEADEEADSHSSILRRKSNILWEGKSTNLRPRPNFDCYAILGALLLMNWLKKIKVPSKGSKWSNSVLLWYLLTNPEVTYYQAMESAKRFGWKPNSNQRFEISQTFFKNICI